MLALLEGEPRYGYDLVVELSASGLLAGEGTMYPLLRRLRGEGLVGTAWRESPQGPPRRYYALTTSGSVALEEFRRSWRDFTDSVDAILKER